MKKVIVGTFVACFIMIVPIIGNADAVSVPHFLNYQSLLYDDGGNLLADGPADVTFKISDAAGNVLYEEHQTPDVVNGAVSAVVGNGLDAGGAPLGGIPESVLKPDGSRYLEVTVDGYPPETAMEIVSVPYAVYAEKALGATEGSINGAAIADNSITIDHVTDGLISDLAARMGTAGLIATRTDLTNLQTTYRGSAGASTIGVTGGFVYSGSNNLQGVLQDLDRAIQSRQAGLETVQTSITNETTARVAADTAEASARAAADSAEATARATADAAEAAARHAADDALDLRIQGMEGESGRIKAWGSVDCDDTPVLRGSGATVSFVGAGICRITFSTPFPDMTYAVTVTPWVTTTGPSNSYILLSNKTNSQFDVNLNSITGGSFDFTVVGPQL